MSEQTLSLFEASQYLFVAGVDEVGRGCLAGPVFAAAVILDPTRPIAGLRDSKKLSEAHRQQLSVCIKEQALCWAIGSASNEEIDRINILNASFAAMSRAVEKLSIKPQLLLIDGNRFRSNLNIPYQCIVKGDATFTSIAAASVLAKTYRDEYMMRIADEYPVYNWKQNKGYPTREHREAVLRHGLSPYHRVSFNHSFKQLELFPLDPPKDK